MSSAIEQQKALTERFLAVEEAWDYDANVQLRTDDCTHHLFPAALGHPARNNAKSKEFYASLKPFWANYKIEVLRTTHDAESRTSTLHIMNHSESPAGPFDMESIFVLEFTDDGTKLRKVEEFVDSSYLTSFFEKLAEAQSKDF